MQTGPLERAAVTEAAEAPHRARSRTARQLRVAYDEHLCLNQTAVIIYLEEEDGAEKGEEAESDQTHLSQVQLDTKAKVERGRNQVFGEL